MAKWPPQKLEKLMRLKRVPSWLIEMVETISRPMTAWGSSR